MRNIEQHATGQRPSDHVSVSVEKPGTKDLRDARAAIAGCAATHRDDDLLGPPKKRLTKEHPDTERRGAGRISELTEDERESGCLGKLDHRDRGFLPNRAQPKPR